MHTKLKRVALSLAALTAASAGLVLSSTTANAAGTLAGPAALSPSSGGLATSYTLTPPAGAACNGDSATDQYSVRSFMTSEDPTTVTWAGTLPQTASGFTQPLFRATGGSPFTNGITAPDTGQILTIPSLSFNSLPAGVIPNGPYTLAIACVVGGETDTFYSTQVTFTNDAWSFGVAQDAPVISLGAGTGTEQTISIDNPDASIDSYTLNVTPAPGGALPTVNPGDTSFELTGLTLGTDYDVTLDAVKAGFPDASSNLVEFTAAASYPISVEALAVFEGEDIIVGWDAPTAPVGVPDPDSYTVVISGGPGSVNVSQAGVTSAGTTTDFATTFLNVVGGVETFPAGTYDVTVTGVYSGTGVASSGTTTVGVQPGALVRQELTVTRPLGALILTQRCGVWNGQGAFTAVDGVPGYPRNLGAIVGTTNQTGTAPTLDNGSPDGEFNNYPFPNRNYGNPLDPAATPFGNVTECGLNMGVARLQTSGNLAGQFFVANGQLNEVTVLDTRDIDTGWELRGDIEDRFTTDPAGDTFSGNYLGWIPQATDDSGVVGGEGYNGTSTLYDQTVTRGGDVLPGDGFDDGDGFDYGDIGMTDNPILGEAAANQGLGISTHDARMLLLIPTSVNSGNYSATLTLTVAPKATAP